MVAVLVGDGDLDEVLFACAFDSSLTLNFRSPFGYLVASMVRALDCAGRFQYDWSPNPFVVLVFLEFFIRQLCMLYP